MSNMVDGNVSTLLTSIGLGCHSHGDIGTVRIEHPEFKKLQNGTINELKITVKDEKGNVINNNDLPIYITLELQWVSMDYVMWKQIVYQLNPRICLIMQIKTIYKY